LHATTTALPPPAVRSHARGVTRPMARITAIVAAALLSGCATLVGSGPAADIYDLSPPTDFGAASGRTRAQLLVPPPSAIGALATQRIAVRPDRSRISYYPNAVWSDELPAMLQLKLVRAFENSGRAAAVGRPGDSLSIDYQVIVDVRAFEVDIADGGSAHVQLGVKLLDDRNGRVRASRIVTARVPSPTDGIADIVAALDRAADEAIVELVNWTTSTL
jgi:cholesterol transport system auxiliary component